ncbi:ATP-dependent DNA helicase PIF1 [Merluccius polli]|uniref:ATP-dependent DNA helicase PIF1 n=2 Tax=Merluccius polli TaxID=89951 RepID=A0AA47MDR4_MERPO|nr:ATP-dependent DNA helicase PIF1 [Merluccius polli]
MVDHKLLAYIHGHLRQIKQPGNYSPFGNVSVIAVEDFYQLPPVKGKPLYLDDDSVGLWTQFQIVELKTIVRQKDVVFAELLNRVRCRSKGSPMLDSDIQLLKHCETGEDSSDLHIFPTNKQVRCHDIQQLFKSCPEYVQIEAKDFVTSKTTGKLVLKEGHHTKTYNTSLDQTLVLGVGACVMLLKNLDVDDGLVNGVCGTVTHVVYPDNDDKFPKMIFVKFDDDQVGTKMRSCSAFVAAVEMGSTGIEPEEERVTKHDIHLKPPGYVTFEQFYSHGHVGLNDGLHAESIVDTNRSKFEINGDELDNSQNSVDPDAVLEEQEQERLQCLDKRNHNEQPSDEPVEGIPDLAVSNRQVSNLEKRPNVLCRSDGLALIRSLNDTQLSLLPD